MHFPRTALPFPLAVAILISPSVRAATLRADAATANITPPEQHAAGSHETWRGRASPLATNAIPQITEAFPKLLETANP